MTDLEDDGVRHIKLIVFCMAGGLHGLSGVRRPGQLGGGGRWKPRHGGLRKGVPSGGEAGHRSFAVFPVILTAELSFNPP